MANPYFNAEYYLAQNPDVFAAGINTAEAAWEHYVNFGAAEALNGATSRKPAPWFDIAFYLADNPDLNTAGLTAGQLLDHFTNFGISEGRSPNADDNVDAATMSAYAVANPDLVEAFDIEDPTDLTDDEVTALAQHFYAFGYNEDRPGVPYDPSDLDPDPNDGQTFTLTTAPDLLTGTTGDDTFNATVNPGGVAVAGPETLNATDVINGGGGTDTMNIMVIGGAATGTLKGRVSDVEIINIIGDQAADRLASINANFFEGATQIWQIGGAAGAAITNVNADQTIGFRDRAVTGDTVSVADGVNEVSVALDGVTGTASLSFGEATTGDLETINVSGSVDSTVTAITVDTTAGATAATELNLAISSDVTVTIGATGLNATLETLDFSASTGDITVDLEADSAVAVTSIVGGSGDDTITTEGSTGTADVTIEAGAGADTIVLTGLTGTGTVTLVFNEGDTGRTLATADTIGDGLGSDFVSGDNFLDFNLEAGSATNFLNGGASSSFVDAATNAATAFAEEAGVLQYFASDDGTDTWLFVDRDLDGTFDEAITLLGFTGLAAADIIA